MTTPMSSSSSASRASSAASSAGPVTGGSPRRSGRTPLDRVDRRTPLLQAIMAQARLELVLLVRSGESLIVTFGIPLGVLVFFSLVDVVPTGGGDPVTFLVPGVLAISIAATGLVAVSIQTAFERKYGVLKRLGGTPLPRWGFLAAKSLAVAGLLVVQLGLVVAVAAMLGWRPAGGLIGGVVAALVGAGAFTALGLLMAGTLKAELTLALSNATFIVLLVVSGVTFTADTLPDALATIGGVLPLGALAEVLRVALAGDGLAVVPLLVVAAWGAVAAVVAARTFRWEP